MITNKTNNKKKWWLNLKDKKIEDDEIKKYL